MASTVTSEHWRTLQKSLGASGTTLQEAVSALAKTFGVEWHEVALLRLKGQQLEFIFPQELNAAGTIPISSSAIAARTATSRTAALFNDFTQVAHHSVFEVVPLAAAKCDFNPQRIHKLMSAPIVGSDGQTIGVVQISRKGPTREAAGPDFVEADLLQLEAAAQNLAPSFAALSSQ